MGSYDSHDPDERETPPPRREAALAALAAAVVMRAVLDAAGARYMASPAEQGDARAFLTDTDADGWLSFWLSLLGLDPRARAAARERLRARVTGNGGRQEKAKTP